MTIVLSWRLKQAAIVSFSKSMEKVILDIISVLILVGDACWIVTDWYLRLVLVCRHQLFLYIFV